MLHQPYNYYNNWYWLQNDPQGTPQPVGTHYKIKRDRMNVSDSSANARPPLCTVNSETNMLGLLSHRLGLGH